MFSELPVAYSFGPFVLDVASKILTTTKGARVPIKPKVMDLLVAFVRRKEMVVSREELMREVWPDAYVDETNLTQHIALLRKTLSVGGSGREFIETVPKRGYRFTSQVEETISSVVSPTVIRRSLAVIPFECHSGTVGEDYLERTRRII